MTSKIQMYWPTQVVCSSLLQQCIAMQLYEHFCALPDGQGGIQQNAEQQHVPGQYFRRFLKHPQMHNRRRTLNVSVHP